MALRIPATKRSDATTDAAARLAARAWDDARRQIEEAGYTVLEGLLTAAECRGLVELYPQAERFRSRVVMQRHGYGQG